MDVHPRKRPALAIVLSFVGGLIVLGAGVGLFIIRSLALTGNLLPPLEGLVGQSYAPMLGTGFAQGASYEIGVVTGIIPGIVMIFGALMMLAMPTRTDRFAYVVLAFAFISLIGVGGLAVGAFIGILGGALGVMTRQSSPKLTLPSQPDPRFIE